MNLPLKTEKKNIYKSTPILENFFEDKGKPLFTRRQHGSNHCPPSSSDKLARTQISENQSWTKHGV